VNYSEIAARLERDLRDNFLPYWYRTAIDRTEGGYRLDDRLRRPRDYVRAAVAGTARLLRRAAPPSPRPREWHIVAQSRLLYVFSLAHRLGYGTRERNYLEAAEHGFQFLTNRMRDTQHGGFFWRVGKAGEVRSSDKWLYGQSFALYAFVEFYRATGRSDVLRDAVALFELIQEKMVDHEHGGWIELALADFSQLPNGRPTAETGIHHVSGLKSGNGNLHLMEALSELYDVTKDARVRVALEEVLRINVECFFARPGLSPSHVTADWHPVTTKPFDYHSYGHDMEFAWLMLRAQQVLGIPLGLELFGSLMSYSMERGFDWTRGGFYLKGRPGAPNAYDTSKVWWVQGEALAALTDALCIPGSGDHARYDRCLHLLMDWIWKYQRLPDGVWVWSREADGRLQNPTKADSWKAGYHEFRAMAKAIESLRSLRP
jgi:mannose/cellobiose epimerase-like protein (N-acyl-D-glucosamine 2-epimerase family)